MLLPVERKLLQWITECKAGWNGVLLIAEIVLIEELRQVHGDEIEERIARP